MDSSEPHGSSPVDNLKCCILTKQSDSSFAQCRRFAFKPLTKDLIDVITKKNLPLYFDSTKGNRLVLCLCHRRMILNVGKFNDSYQKLNLMNYEIGEQKELQEFLDDFSSHCRDSSTQSTSSNTSSKLNKSAVERYENLWKRYRSFDREYDPDLPNTKTTSKYRNGDKSNNGDDLKIPFSALSAMALRRYKKFFKLPNRSGTSSKPQLLEGIYEHIESIPVDQAETAAFFMYTIRNKKNRLDHPNDGDDDSSIHK